MNQFQRNTRFILKPLAAAVLFGLSASPLLAATDAGTLLQETKPGKVQPPSGKTDLRVQPAVESALPVTEPFDIKSVRIKGNALFDTATLHAMVAGAEGQRMSLQELGSWVAKITEHYRKHGHMLSRAIIPAQKIENGVVVVEVIEARYGEVTLTNNSRIEEELLREMLASLKPGAAIEQDPMDHALLTMSDVPGAQVKATLKPGKATGTSDMDVTVDTGNGYAGNVTADNYGNRYIGKSRVTASVNFYSPMHHGDTLTLNAITTGKGMTFGRISYDWLLNGGNGMHVGGALSNVNYTLGDTLAPLLGHGTAQVASLWLKSPFERSRDLDWYGSLQFDNKKLRDRIDLVGTRTDRTLNNWTLSVNGDSRDELLAGGVNSWNLGWTAGNVAFNDGAALAADAATANTRGSFNKFALSASRVQGLTANDLVAVNLSAQFAGKNLDSSEKMAMGGPNTVRAYDMGAISGDEGYFASLEYRHSFTEGLQALLFVDTASVTVNRNPWAAGTNSATLTGWGVGVNWSADPFRMKASVATQAGALSPLIASPSRTRGWLELGLDF